jgi:transcriptional regulator with XRE-family HTH domain
LTVRCWEDHINSVSCHPIQREIIEADRERQRLIEQVRQEFRDEGLAPYVFYPRTAAGGWTNDRIKALRLNRGLNIREMAELFGVSETAWKWWERGMRVPRANFIDRLVELERDSVAIPRVYHDRPNDPGEWTAAHIRQLRIDLDYSQREMAELIGVTKSAWSQWEIGHRVPRHDYLVKMIELDASHQPDHERMKRSNRTIEHSEWTADRIKQLRLDLGYKQSEIANLVGVAVQSWSLWETGVNRPKPENIARLIELDGGGRIA